MMCIVYNCLIISYHPNYRNVLIYTSHSSKAKNCLYLNRNIYPRKDVLDKSWRREGGPPMICHVTLLFIRKIFLADISQTVNEEKYFMLNFYY